MTINPVDPATKKRRVALPLLLVVFLMMGGAWLLQNRILSLVASLVLGVGFSSPSSGAGEDGFLMLMEAARNSGLNPAILHSGRITARREQTREISEAEIQRDVADYKRHLEERLAIFSKSRDVANRDLTLKSIENAQADRRKALHSLYNKTSKYEFTFRGVEPFTDVKQRILSAEPDADREFIAIGSHLKLGTDTFLRKDSDSSPITVDRSYAAYPFNEFGRARGRTLQCLTAMLLLGTADHGDHRFNQGTIARIRGHLKNGSGYSIQKQVEFEGGTVSVVEISPQRPSITDRFGVQKALVWIDPARGYICPKIEEYVGDRVFKSYESSGYFLDRNSGLWWPRSHVETEYDTNTGAVKSRVAYAMTPEETALNVPIDDDEFAFRAKRGMEIADNQEGTGPRYYVANDTSLRMKHGVLDLTTNSQDLILARRGPGWNPANLLTAMVPGSLAIVAVIALGLSYMLRSKSVETPA